MKATKKRWLWLTPLVLLLLFIISLVAYTQAHRPQRQPIANSNTTELAVPGGLQLQSQTWSGQVRIKGTVTFLPSATLTIMPGSKIIFDKGPEVELGDWLGQADAYIKDHNDPTGRVGYQKNHYGLMAKILAVGTPDKKIIFTSAQPQPEYADWDQLVLFDRSKLEYVEVAYSHNGVNLHGGNVEIAHSTIHDSLWSCIDVFSVNNFIHDNQVYHCWHQSIGFKVVGANIVDRNNAHDAKLSVHCENGANPSVTNNTFTAAPSGDCQLDSSNKVVNQPADVPGGTYGGTLIYPAD